MNIQNVFWGGWITPTSAFNSSEGAALTKKYSQNEEGT